MIAIQVGGQALDMIPGQTLTLNSVCPVFDRERIDRLYTLPFRLPTTARNIAALGPFSRIDADLTQSIPAQLFIDRTPYDQGVLRLISPGIESGEWVFQSVTLRLKERLERIRLRDFNIPVTVAAPYRPTLLLNAFRTGTTFFITLGINDLVFTADANDLDSIVAQVNAVWPGSASVFLSSFDNQQMLLTVADEPEAFLIRAVPLVPDPTGHSFFFVADSTYEVETARISDAWASVLAEPAPEAAAYPVTSAPLLYAEKNPAYSGYANYTDLAGIHPNDAVTPFTATGWPHTIVPFPRVPTVLETIAEGASILLDAALFSDEDLAALCLWGNLTLDVVRHSKEYQEGGPVTLPVHTYPASYDLTRHLPDITASEMLIRLANTFCLYLVEQGGALVVRPCAALLDAPPRDWTDYVDAAEYDAQYDSRTGFTLDYDRQGDETNILGQLQRQDGGLEADTYIPGFYTLHDVVLGDAIEITRAWRVPLINELGTVPFFGISRAPTLRLLFDHGPQPDSLGNTYAFASHGTQNFLGQEVGAYSLDWQGPDGLFAQWWATFIATARRNQRITLPMRLPLFELIQLRDWQQVVYSIYHPHGHFIGAIERIRTTITEDGVGISQVTFLKM